MRLFFRPEFGSGQLSVAEVKVQLVLAPPRLTPISVCIPNCLRKLVIARRKIHNDFPLPA